MQCSRPWFNPWVGRIPLEKGTATHSSILAWRIPWTVSQSCKELDATEWLSHNHISHSLTPEHLPNLGIKPRSPALNADSSPSEPPGKPPSSCQYEDRILLKWENTAQGLMRPYVLLLWSWHSRADHISPSWGGLQSPQCGRREYSQSARGSRTLSRRNSRSAPFLMGHLSPMP